MSWIMMRIYQQQILLATFSVLMTLLLGVVSGCKHDTQQRQLDSQLDTDLGPIGNQQLKDRFDAYVARGVNCEAHGNGKRVILTGFGLFSGVSFNISGVIVDTMADAPAAETGLLRDDHHGGKVVNKQELVNGQLIEFCFLTLDVQWDLAAAIIVREMQNFQPDLVIMTGRGDETSVIFEAGARNEALKVSGYNSDGSRARHNTPIQPPILPPTLEGVEDIIAMTWNNRQMLEATHHKIAALGFRAVTTPSARISNNYICNNISFVALHAAKGIPIQLGAGILELQMTPESIPQIGFMHLPARATRNPAALAAWRDIVMTMVSSALHN